MKLYCNIYSVSVRIFQYLFQIFSLSDCLQTLSDNIFYLSREEVVQACLKEKLEPSNGLMVKKASALLPENQMKCLTDIESNIKTLKSYLEKNLKAKENVPEIPQTGLAVLQQQFVLAQSIETWIDELKLKYE